jgi:spore coat protein H
MNALKNYCCFFLLSSFMIACAQQGPIYEAPKGSYGIDHKHRLIVLNLGDTENFSTELTTLQLEESFQFSSPTDELKNDSVYSVEHEGVAYQLYITKTPVINIRLQDTALTKEEKNSAIFRYFDKDTSFQSHIGMKLRGNLSLTYPKKSFSIEFYKDSLKRSKKDIDFKDLSKEDDWILDGLYNEPLLLRANTSQQLWKSIHIPSYIDQEPKARSTVDGFYVDLFVNNEYRGIYFLSEKVKRSLLEVKKYENEILRGEIFKAGRYLPGTSFKDAPDFNNAFPTWAGFEMEYPYEDFTSHWDRLHETITFIAQSSSTDFATKIGEHFDLQNLTDYFLYINLLRATDNLGKNYYLARYDTSTPYFIVPWDLDGTLGTIMDGRRIPTTNDILSNNLFDRLLKDHPDFKNLLKNRWKSLRTGEFSNEALEERIRSTYEKLNGHKMYERDHAIWKIQHTEEHLDYMLQWLEERLSFMDSYFAK